MLAFFSLVAPNVSAQVSSDELARRHFESGVAYLQESDYDNALNAFIKAYELSERAPILLNVATVHERKGDLPAAIQALKDYLAVAPEAEDRATVENRLQNLEARHAQAVAVTPEPEPEPSSPPVAESPPPEPAPSPSPSPPVADSPPQKPDRTLAYVSLGVGAAAAIGAGVTGALALSEHRRLDSSCAPNCTDSDIERGERLALVNTVLVGVAAVGVGVGLVLWFGTDAPSEQPTTSAPRLSVGVMNGKVAANALWRF